MVTITNWYKKLVFADDYKYACVLAPLDDKLSKDILSFSSSKIADNDLADDGREYSPHITVLYGMHSDEPGEASKAIASLSPIEIELGSISVFTTHTDYDVIKIEVESEGLYRAHEMLKNFPHTLKYKDYNPHATLAYVAKGHCRYLIGDTIFKGRKSIIEILQYNSRNGNIVDINLRGNRRQACRQNLRQNRYRNSTKQLMAGQHSFSDHLLR